MNTNLKRIGLIVILMLLAAGAIYIYNNSKKSKYYTMNDFSTVEKIDAHIHIQTENPEILKIAREDNVRLLTINTDAGNSITKQRDYALYQSNAFPGQISFATTFSMEGWEEPGWQEKTIAYLDESFKKGAIAVKIWKNIGMTVKDKDGNFLMIDNPVFEQIFDFMVKMGKPLVFHIAEPKNCWLPLEKMTVNSDMAYFKAHPIYHMYLHSDYPSYEELIEDRDNMIAKHPSLKIIGCHLGSLEWDIDEIAKRLDRFPNFAVDMAERVCHLQVQSRKDREKVRNFILKYSDRLLYGSDFIAEGNNPVERIHKLWIEVWRYFVTDEMMTAPEFEGEFKALNLPREVVDKIFRTNAETWYPEINNQSK